MPQAAILRDRAAAFRPRFVRDAIILGRSTVLARRAVERGCYCIDKPDDDVLAALLSLAYEKRIHRYDPIFLSILRATDVLLKSPERVDALLAHLPEPSQAGNTHLPQAERLLKVGTRPDDLEGALRRDRLGLREAPAYTDHLTLCDKGVVLGKGTVIAAIEDSVGVGLALKDREERILALLSVASGQAIDADVLHKFEAASRALGGGNVSLAAILLAHVGLPPLAHAGMAKAVALAAAELDRGVGAFDLLKGLDLLPAGMGYADWSPVLRKFNPNHVGPGCPEGGQFCSADQAGDGANKQPNGQQVALWAIERQFITPEIEQNVKSVLSNVTNGTLSSDDINALYDAVVKSIDEDEATLFANINPNSDVITLSQQQFEIVEKEINALKDPTLKTKAQAGLNQALANGKVRIRK